MEGGDELFFEDFSDQDKFTSQMYLSLHLKHVMLHPTSSTYIPAFIQFLFESQLWKDAAEMLTKSLKTPTTAVIAEHADLLVDMRYLLSQFNVRWEPYKLWIAFAKLYEVHNHISTARAIFDKAVQMDYYRSVEELVTLWEEWADMEMVYDNSAAVLELMKRATTEPSIEEVRRQKRRRGGSVPAWMKLHKSLSMWKVYLELEFKLGTLESERAIYERMLDLKITPPQIVVFYYAQLFEAHNLFEEAFEVYERGIKMFKYPTTLHIWMEYLSLFVERYGKIKLEKARQLFDRALEMTPAYYAKPLYLQYAKLEETFGLAERALELCDQAAKCVPSTDKMYVYQVYIAYAAKINMGVPKMREIYELAIKSGGILDKDVQLLGMKYAELEISLGEIDRARAIYKFTSQYADPQYDDENADFWRTWLKFEMQHKKPSIFQKMLKNKQIEYFASDKVATAKYCVMFFIAPCLIMCPLYVLSVFMSH